MKRTTGFWLMLTSLAAGAAIGAICSSKAAHNGKCRCDKCGRETNGRFDELKEELMAEIKQLKKKFSSL